MAIVVRPIAHLRRHLWMVKSAFRHAQIQLRIQMEKRVLQHVQQEPILMRLVQAA